MKIDGCRCLVIARWRRRSWYVVREYLSPEVLWVVDQLLSAAVLYWVLHKHTINAARKHDRYDMVESVELRRSLQHTRKPRPVDAVLNKCVWLPFHFNCTEFTCNWAAILPRTHLSPPTPCMPGV